MDPTLTSATLCRLIELRLDLREAAAHLVAIQELVDKAQLAGGIAELELLARSTDAQWRALNARYVACLDLLDGILEAALGA